MEALIPLLAIVSLGLLAMRFGADSRPAIRSEEHRLALSGMVWDSPARPADPAVAPPPGTDAADGPVIRQLIWAQPGSASSPFPILQALDLARDPGQSAFATDPDAGFLEQRARHVTSQHWSERVWLTGLIDQVRFDLVCDALERDREDLRRARQGVEVVAGSAQPSRIAS